MAADHGKTTRWAWDTKLTTLATNTTLGTATRYDTENQTIYVPETTRTVKRALVRVTIRDATTGGASVDVDGVRIGIKINAVAFSDLDITTTKANTGNTFVLEYERDVTSYFVTNDPATASFTANVGIAVATGSASIINNITFELFLTYDYDSAASTQADTALFPIQSHTTTIPTAGTYVEVGSTGTSSAPVNQIRQLTGTGGAFDGVTGFTLRKRYLIVHAHDAIATTGDVTPKYRFDGGADNVRAVLEAASNRAARYVDIIDITSLSTTAAHSFEVTSDVNARMSIVGALDIVSYEFTASSDQMFVSVTVPLDNLSSYDVYAMSEPGSAAADALRYTATIDIQEEGPITMDQCGIAWTSEYSNPLVLSAPGQTSRSYTVDTTAKAGNSLLIHRTDHNHSTWSLRRGANQLHVDYSVIELNDMQQSTGYAIINYRCAGGEHWNKNRTVFASQIMSYVESDFLYEESSPTAPTIIESAYTLGGAMANFTINAFIGAERFGPQAQRQPGEDSGKGWYGTGNWSNNVTAGNEFACNVAYLNVTRWFRRNPDTKLSGADVEATRKWRVEQAALASTNWTWQVALFLTYHTITHTGGGTYYIDNDTALTASQADTVDVVAYDHTTRVGEIVAFDLDTDGSGDFTYTAYDNTRKFRALGKNGSAFGTSLPWYIGDAAEAPKIVGVGAQASGTGAIAVIAPDHRPYDILLMLVESKNGEAVSTPSGWTALASSGTDAATTRLSAFYRRATDYMSVSGSIGVNDSGDHTIARIWCIRGAIETGNPFDIDSGTTAASGTAVSIAGATPTVTNTLAIVVVSNTTDSATAQITPTTWANADLLGFRAFGFAQAADGDGGGFDIACGVRSAASAFGASTATLGSASAQAKLTLVVKPKATALPSFSSPDLPLADVYDILAYTSVASSGGFAASQVYGGLGA